MPGTIEELIVDPTWKGRIAEARRAGHSYEDIESSLRQRGVLDMGASTTTTPTTRTLPQAIGETVQATAERPVQAGQDFLHRFAADPNVLAAERAQGVQPPAGPMSALGQVGGALGPFVAPEMTAGGMMAESMRRMQPGTTEPQAAQAAGVGQIAAGMPQLLTGAARLGPAVASRVAARRAPATLGGALRDAGVDAALAERMAGDETVFAQKVQAVFNRWFKDLERVKKQAESSEFQESIAGVKIGKPTRGSFSDKNYNDLKTLVGKTQSLKPIADMVAKDPALMAQLVAQGGPELIPDLQSAWMSTTVREATGQQGLGRGLVDGKILNARWQDLGEVGQRALYGDEAPKISELFQAIVDSTPQGQKGTAAFSVAQKLLATAAGAGAGVGVGEAIAHYGARKVGLVGLPLLIGGILAKPGAAAYLTAIVRTMGDERAFTNIAPTLINAGRQLLTPDPRPPAPQPMTPFAAPAAPPAVPSGMHHMYPTEGMDTYPGIQALVDTTRLPPGFRPLPSPYAR